MTYATESWSGHVDPFEDEDEDDGIEIVDFAETDAEFLQRVMKDLEAGVVPAGRPRVP